MVSEDYRSGSGPRPIAAATRAAAFSAFSSGSVTLEGMRVLVVDDEPAVRQALDRALRFEGYQTEAAEDGPSALGAHAERPADAIVLDVAMPRMDGLEVCRRLRQAGDHTPVLMLTARAAVNDRVAGLDAGADDYLVKPFALEELLARIRALLRRSAPAGRRRGAALRRPVPGPGHPGGPPRRPVDGADPHRVPAAGAAAAQRPPGAARGS